MGSKRRNRDRRKARGARPRKPRRRLLVVCEGACTEPDYIHGYERHVRNATVKVELSEGQGDPLRIVQKAKRLKQQAARRARTQGDDFLDYDEVWCVFDRDEHARFDAAIALAQRSTIALAVSNPCVELWLLLHFRESPGARHRDDLRRMLRDDFLPGYDKHLDFERLVPGVAEADKRAERLARDAEALGDDPFKNPTTGFYLLTRSIARRGDGG